MTEREKIENIIKEYQSLFMATDMDVCHSIKDVWYFTRYNKQYNYYDCLVRFETAEELVQIILGELALDMNCTIGNNPEAPRYSNGNFADDVQTKVNYQEYIERLLSKEGYEKRAV